MRQAQWLLTASLMFAATAGVEAQAAADGADSATPLRVVGGFVVNGPEQLLGVGVGWLPGFLGGWGLYLDFKTDADSPARSERFITMSAEEAQEIGDERRFTDHSYTSMNAAVLRTYGSNVTLYAGGGVTNERVYSEFFDDTGTRGRLGLYWAEYAGEGGIRTNLMVGLFFRVNRAVIIQFGAEAVPTGMTVGLHLGL